MSRLGAGGTLERSLMPIKPSREQATQLELPSVVGVRVAGNNAAVYCFDTDVARAHIVADHWLNKLFAKPGEWASGYCSASDRSYGRFATVQPASSARRDNGCCCVADCLPNCNYTMGLTSEICL